MTIEMPASVEKKREKERLDILASALLGARINRLDGNSVNYTAYKNSDPELLVIGWDDGCHIVARSERFITEAEFTWDRDINKSQGSEYVTGDTTAYEEWVTRVSEHGFYSLDSLCLHADPSVALDIAKAVGGFPLEHMEESIREGWFD